LPRPKAILAVSAHWETDSPRAATTAQPETIHDFHGFPEELYSLRYPAPGAPELALRAVELLSAAGFSAAADAKRGLDHGAWAPLLLAYPEADVPVAQLSIQPSLGPAHHLAMGRALAPLRGEGVLVFGSGGATHNLSEVAWGRHGDPLAWARAFDDWLAETISAGDAVALPDWRARAPHAARAHPRDEHLLPLLVTFGAAGDGGRGARLHTSFVHGSLSMAAFRFE
jgi:4,5-DOPA dioxygenase extradiol